MNPEGADSRWVPFFPSSGVPFVMSGQLMVQKEGTICPIRSMRLEIAVGLAMTPLAALRGIDGRVPVLPSVSPLLFDCLLGHLNSSSGKASRWYP